MGSDGRRIAEVHVAAEFRPHTRAEENVPPAAAAHASPAKKGGESTVSEKGGAAPPPSSSSQDQRRVHYADQRAGTDRPASLRANDSKAPAAHDKGSVDGGDLVDSLLARAVDLRDRMAVALHSDSDPLRHLPGLSHPHDDDLEVGGYRPSATTDSVSSASSGPFLDALLEGYTSQHDRLDEVGSPLPSPPPPPQRSSQRRSRQARERPPVPAAAARDDNFSAEALRHGRRQEEKRAARHADAVQQEQQRDASLVLGRERLRLLTGLGALRLGVDHLTLGGRVAAEMGANYVFFVDYDLGGERRGRLPSARQEGALVVFARRTAMSLTVDEELLQDWLARDAVFTVYAKQRGLQQVRCLARAVLPLRSLLLADQFALSELIPVNELSGANVGHLSVSLALTPTLTADAGPAFGEPSFALDYADGAGGAAALSSHDGDPESVPPHSGNRHDHPTADGATDLPLPAAHKHVLYLLLHVAEAHNMAERGGECMPGARNLYLVCRVLAPADQSRTDVFWHDGAPRFNHQHSEPVALTADLLARLDSNVCVVEVWDRCALPDGGDLLVGLAKLTLHPFFLAFRHRAAVEDVLRGDLPVVAVNEFVPVHDLRSAKAVGLLRVLLAMGSRRQVTTMARHHVGVLAEQRLVGRGGPAGGIAAVAATGADDGNVTVERASRAHTQNHDRLGEHDNDNDNGDGDASSDAPLAVRDIDHVFDISIVAGRELSLFSRHVHGETDCFVRFRFPSGASGFETVSTQPVLCVPNPVFNGRSQHTIRLRPPQDVQHFLLGLGLDGIAFELWERRYYPDIADQLVARGSLPVGRLVRMAGEFRGAPVRVDWNIELHSTADDTLVGLLEGRATYTAQKSVAVAAGRLGRGQVSLHVVRAAGLLDAFAANTIGEKQLNIMVRASVRAGAHARQASGDRAAWVETPALYANSANPDIDCTLTLPGAGDHVAVEVWHRPAATTSAAAAGQDDEDALRPRDVFLGSVLVRLPPIPSALYGWFALHRIEAGVQSAATGAIELELVGTAATPLAPIPDGLHQLQIFVEDATLPAGLDLASCYVRYSLLGEPARCSTVAAVGVRQWCNLQHADQHMISFTEDIQKLVAERPLEVEFWGTSAAQPSDSDLYLGSAFVDISPLVFNQRSLVSDVYPLIKPRCPSFGGARTRIRVLCQAVPRSTAVAVRNNTLPYSTGNAAATTAACALRQSQQRHGPSLRDEAKLGRARLPREGDGVPLYVTVQAAMHLPDARGAFFLVTYDCDGDPVRTHAVDGSAPVWDHRRCVHLHPQGRWGDIVFKVWRRSDNNAEDKPRDLLVGQASVDLGALQAGMRELCGWYHVLDSRGVRQGQLKVHIVPLSAADGGTAQGLAFAEPVSAARFGWAGREEAPEAPRSGPVAAALQDVASLPEDVSRSFLTQRLRENLAELEALKTSLPARVLHHQPHDSAAPPPAAAGQGWESAVGTRGATEGGAERQSRWEGEGQLPTHAPASYASLFPSAEHHLHRHHHHHDHHQKQQQQDQHDHGDEDEHSFALSSASSSPASSPFPARRTLHTSDEPLRRPAAPTELPPTSNPGVFPSNAGGTAPSASATAAIARPAQAPTSAPATSEAAYRDATMDEIHRRAQELLRARPVFRPDIIQLSETSMAAVRNTFLPPAEMRRRMEDITNTAAAAPLSADSRGGVRGAAAPPMSAEETRRVARIFSSHAEEST